MQRLDDFKNTPSRPSRSASYSSDVPPSPVLSSLNSLSSPSLTKSSIEPAPAYVAESAAVQLVADAKALALQDVQDPSVLRLLQYEVVFKKPKREEHEEPKEAEALTHINTFLDYVLYKILGSSRSPGLQALRTAVEQVLVGKLGKSAINAADEELDELVADGDEEEIIREEAMRAAEPISDVDFFFRRTRLRVMVYMRLGEKEDDLESEYLERHESPNANSELDIRDEGLVSWAGAIFLTSVLEYVAEECLKVAGQAAYKRALANMMLAATAPPNTHPNDRVVQVEKSDVDKAALDKTLQRIWRSWKHKTRGRNLDQNRSISGQRSGLNSRKGSISTISSEAARQIQHDSQLPSATEEADESQARAGGDGSAQLLSAGGAAIDASNIGAISQWRTSKRPSSLVIPGSAKLLDTDRDEPASADEALIRRRARASTLPSAPLKVSARDTPIVSPDWATPSDVTATTESETAVRSAERSATRGSEDDEFAEAPEMPQTSEDSQISEELQTSEGARDLKQGPAEEPESREPPQSSDMSPATQGTAEARPTSLTRSMKPGIIDVSDAGLSQPDELARAAALMQTSPTATHQTRAEAQAQPSANLPFRDESTASHDGTASTSTSFEESSRSPSVAVPFGSTRTQPTNAYMPTSSQPPIARPRGVSDRLDIPKTANASPINPLSSHPITSATAKGGSPKRVEIYPGAYRRTSNGESPNYSRHAANSSREVRSGSGTYKPEHFARGSVENTGRKYSNSSPSARTEKDFGDLLAAKETMKYTLTPRQLQNIEQPDSSRYVEHDPYSTQHSSGYTVSRVISPVRTTSATTPIKESPSPVSPVSRSVSPLPPQTDLKPSKAGYVPREARAQTDPTLERGDYLKASGADRDRGLDTPVSPLDVAPSSQIRGGPRSSYDSSRSKNSVIPSARRYAAAAREHEATSIPGMPKKASKSHLQPREAKTERRANMELIEFLREGPPSANGARVVSANDRKYTPSSANRTSSLMTQSAGTSVNSYSGLTNTATSRVAPFRQAEPEPATNGNSVVAPTAGKRQYRNKDPYALPSDNEEDDEFEEETYRAPPRRKEESLAEFLKNAEPPSATKPGIGSVAGANTRVPSAKYGTYDDMPLGRQGQSGHESKVGRDYGSSRPFWRKKSAA